jgi:hypothetical protein
VALSSSEYIAAVNTACEAIWSQRILVDLHVEQSNTTDTYCENQTVLKLTKHEQQSMWKFTVIIFGSL